MKIAGLEPLTLQDYPGEIAAVFFTTGCNLRCPYCHNPELVEACSDIFSENEILDFLKDRQQYLDAIVISGGEPLTQPDLVDFAARAKKLGYKIRLDTNGTRPAVLQKLINQKLLDMVGWDYKLPRQRYQELLPVRDQDQHPDCNTSADSIKDKQAGEQAHKLPDKIFQTGQLLSRSAIPLEIRTTAVPGLVTAKDIKEIAREIAELNFKQDLTYAIQGFRNQQVLDQSLAKITPYSLKKLQEFQELAEKYLADVIIRKNI